MERRTVSELFVEYDTFTLKLFYLNFVAIYISTGNLVILAGSNETYSCYSSYAAPYWHFYSLTLGAAPCGFNSSSRYPGIPLCPSVPRISVKYSSTAQHNKTTLTIRQAQLADAGTYVCGGRNPYDHSATVSVIVGVIGT